jgi:hypothetical protein
MREKKLPGSGNYEALPDIEGESYHGTPRSITPLDHHKFPGDKQTNSIKRKKDALGSLPDNEERSGTPAKRLHSTMPIDGRKRSLVKAVRDLLPFSNGILENPPLLPRNEPPLTLPVNGVELASIQLSPPPLNNKQSGTAREIGGPADASGGHFKAINAACCMILNNTPIVELLPSRDGSDSSARKVQQVSPVRDSDTYAYSPYHNGSSPAAAATKNSPRFALAPPTATTAQVPLPSGLSKVFNGTGHIMHRSASDKRKTIRYHPSLMTPLQGSRRCIVRQGHNKCITLERRAAMTSVLLDISLFLKHLIHPVELRPHMRMTHLED